MRSDEEKQFEAWIYEAVNHGLIFCAEYEPKSYPLTPKFTRLQPKDMKTKVKIVEKHLFHPHGYTPDWEFVILHGPLYDFFIQTAEYGKIVVDVKGGFLDRGSRQEFSINRKLMYEKHRIFVNKIIPEKLFKKTWCPKACRLSPVQKKPVKKFMGCLNINQYMEMG